MSFRHHSLCICSPNAKDETNRDCPVHRIRGLTFGMDHSEITGRWTE